MTKNAKMLLALTLGVASVAGMKTVSHAYGSCGAGFSVMNNQCYADAPSQYQAQNAGTAPTAPSYQPAPPTPGSGASTELQVQICKDKEDRCSRSLDNALMALDEEKISRLQLEICKDVHVKDRDTCDPYVKAYEDAKGKSNDLEAVMKAACGEYKSTCPQ